MKNLDTQTQNNEDVMKGLLGVEQPIPITLVPVYSGKDECFDLRNRFVKHYGEGVKVQDVTEYSIGGRLVRVKDNIEIYHTREEPYQNVLSFINKLSEKLNTGLMIIS